MKRADLARHAAGGDTGNPASAPHRPRKARPAVAAVPDARRRLLDAAAAELVEGGGQMEIAAVARRAGASVGLSYHYFGSKAGLLAALVEDFYDRYDAAVIDANPLPGAAWAERERLRVERLVDFMLAEPMAPLVLTRLSAEPEVAAVEARRLARHLTLGADNIAGAQAKGQLPAGPDPRPRIGMIMGGLRQAIGQALAGPEAWPREALVAELWSFVAMAAGLPARDAAPGPNRPRGRTA
jgi:AcrR family transcriptional regulator